MSCIHGKGLQSGRLASPPSNMNKFDTNAREDTCQVSCPRSAAVQGVPGPGNLEVLTLCWEGGGSETERYTTCAYTHVLTYHC